MDIHLKDIIQPVIVAIILFFGWLMKRSIYGELEDIKKDLDAMKSRSMSVNQCDALREGCSGTVKEKIDHVADMLRIITERQTLLISRMDSHLNNFGGKRDGR